MQGDYFRNVLEPHESTSHESSQAKRQRLNEPAAIELEDGDICMQIASNRGGVGEKNDAMQNFPSDLPSSYPHLESLITQFQADGVPVTPLQLLNELASSCGLVSSKIKSSDSCTISLTCVVNGKIWKEATAFGSRSAETLAASQILEEVFTEIERENMGLEVQFHKPDPPAKETKTIPASGIEVSLSAAAIDSRFPKAQVALNGGKSPVSLLTEICAKSKFALSLKEEGSGTAFVCRGTVVDLSTGATIATSTDASGQTSKNKKQAKAVSATELIEIILAKQDTMAKDAKDQAKNTILLEMLKANRKRAQGMIDNLNSVDMKMVFLTGVEDEDEEIQWGVPKLRATLGEGGIKVLSKIMMENEALGPGSLGSVLASAQSEEEARALASTMNEYLFFSTLNEILAEEI